MTEEKKSSEQTQIVVTAIVVLMLSVFFSALSLTRLIARDEGFYLLAAQLVRQGSIPYRDFFYPQMPLVPYFYALILDFSDAVWMQARLLNAVLTTLLVMLMYFRIRRQRGLLIAVMIALMIATNPLFFPWYVVSKTYNLSSLLMFSVYLLITMGGSRSSLTDAPSRLTVVNVICAGLFFGLCVNSRLIYAGLFPLIILHVANRAGGNRWRRWGMVALVSVGAAISMIPVGLLYLSDSQSFIFNNLTYHTLRSSDPLWIVAAKKVEVLASLFGLAPTGRFIGLQFALLCVLAFVPWVVRLRPSRYKEIDPALWYGIGLFLLHIVPTPAYTQYFSTTVPFFAIAAAQGVYDLAVRWQAMKKPSRLRPVLQCAVVTLALSWYFYAGAKSVHRYSVSGDGVKGLGKDRDIEDWSIEDAEEIAEEVNRLVGPKAPVIALWPGHLVGSHALPIPGTENQFGRFISTKISAEDTARFNVLSQDSMAELINQREPTLVVMTDMPKRPAIQRALKSAGYREVKRHESTGFWKSPSSR